MATETVKIELGFDVGDPDEFVKQVKEKAAYYGFSPKSAILEDGALSLIHQSLDWNVKESIASLTEALKSISCEDGSENDFKYYGSAADEVVAVDLNLRSQGVLEHSDGGYCYTGNFLSLIRNLDGKFVEIAAEVGAVDFLGPSVIPKCYLEEINYLSNFPQHCFFIGRNPYDVRKLPTVSTTSPDFSSLEDAGLCLAPTVCCNVFLAFRGNVLSDHMAISAVGHCHRHEGGNSTGLDRLQKFLMREIVFMGTEESVVASMTKLRSSVVSFLQNLGLSFRLASANDPFFGASEKNLRHYQRLFSLKEEVQAWVPETKNWVSIASFNLHETKLCEASSIRLDDKPAYSACFGFGLERGALAVLSQGLTTTW